MGRTLYKKHQHYMQAEVLEYTNTEINKLQRIENSLFRTIFGARKYTPNATYKGEMKTKYEKQKT